MKCTWEMHSHLQKELLVMSPKKTFIALVLQSNFRFMLSEASGHLLYSMLRLLDQKLQWELTVTISEVTQVLGDCWLSVTLSGTTKPGITQESQDPWVLAVAPQWTEDVPFSKGSCSKQFSTVQISKGEKGTVTLHSRSRRLSKGGGSSLSPGVIPCKGNCSEPTDLRQSYVCFHIKALKRLYRTVIEGYFLHHCLCT